ncbi:MAG TPA: PHP domain-containing protein [Longimicrobiales bacterium]
MRIDLHVHSTASDGSLEPAAVVEAAAAGGLDLIALTDHDTTAGIAEAVAAAEGRIAVVPGVEMSSTHGGEELHILGYFVAPDHPALASFADQAFLRREERMRGMIRRLAELGVRVTYEEVLAGAGSGPVGRPHLARALVQAGHVRDVHEAFDRFLADGGPAFLPTELLTPREAIDLIHAAGGIAVWAHPPLDVLERELDHFVTWGLEGIECYRPMNSATMTRRLEAAARAHGLLTTGGSDWHGIWSGRLGTFHVPRHRVDALLDLGGI